MTVAGTLPGDARKRYFRGTHRTVEPSRTLSVVAPFLGEMGITRVANVTGLDRIGIPVYTVCRPNSRSISVCQGKGLDADAARVSGVMEAVETWHAENIALPVRLGSRDELQRELPLVDVDRLPKSVEELYRPDRPLPWVQGQRWPDGAPLYVPLEIVSADYTLPRLPGSGCFAASTNGLASGNTLAEAVAHGLYEVIERDASTLWSLSRPRARHECGVDPATIDDDDCRALLARFEQAGLEVRTWDVTSDVGIAVFLCLVFSREADASDPEFGCGAHPAREIALARALTEAAQARTTFIAGSRDDFDPALYGREARTRRRAYCLGEAARHRPLRAFADTPTRNADSIESDLNHARERLARAGMDTIVVVDLTREPPGIPVVRVIVPGLEGPRDHDGADYVPGERARAAVADLPL